MAKSSILRTTAGTRCVSAHLPEDVYWQLKEIAASKRMEMKDIILEAANALFRESGKPVFPLATTKKKQPRQPASEPTG